MHKPSAYGLPEQEDEHTRVALDMLQSKMRIGQSQAALLLKSVSENIPRDRYVPPNKMRFVLPKDGTDSIQLKYLRDHGVDETVDLHSHALAQMADTSNLTRNYLGKLHKPSDGRWRHDLLRYNFNTLFENQEFLNRLKEPAEFLHRLVGTELRGFLTQSFNRHINSMPTFAAFMEGCEEFGAAPTRALITDTRVGLQCYLPFAFQPVKGHFVAVGVWWTNSDFGEGKLKLSHTLMSIQSGTSQVMEESYGRVHLGSVVKDTDMRLSDEVARKELDAVCTAIKDAVRKILDPEAVKRLLDLIEKADELQVDWRTAKGWLSRYLNKAQIGDVEGMFENKITDLPPPGIGIDGKPMASRWWCSSALARLAESQSDPEKAADLRQAAGTMLGAAA